MTTGKTPENKGPFVDRFVIGVAATTVVFYIFGGAEAREMVNQLCLSVSCALVGGVFVYLMTRELS